MCKKEDTDGTEPAVRSRLGYVKSGGGDDGRRKRHGDVPKGCRGGRRS